MTLSRIHVPVLITVLILFSAHAGLGQGAEGCTISALTTGIDAKSLRNLEDREPTEIARIDISGAGEGAIFDKTLKIPGTQLFAYVEISFDDDMSFFGDLQDAISVHLIVSNSKKRTQRSILAFAITQTAFGENFKQTGLTASALSGGKRTAIDVVCTGKKPKEK